MENKLKKARAKACKFVTQEIFGNLAYPNSTLTDPVSGGSELEWEILVAKYTEIFLKYELTERS